MEPSDKELQLKRAAKLLLYVQEQLGQTHEAWTQYAVNNMASANDDRPVIELCGVLKELTPEQLERIVYNAHNKTARDLADWWEEHQAADATRELREAAEAKREQLRQEALAKLSDSEKEALGLN